jgi:hypothetical protein
MYDTQMVKKHLQIAPAQKGWLINGILVLELNAHNGVGLTHSKITDHLFWMEQVIADWPASHELSHKTA